MFLPIFIFYLSFFLSFYYDFEFNGIVFIISSVYLLYSVDRLRLSGGLNFRSIWFFCLGLSFISLIWMSFIIDYVGWFWGLLANLISILFLSFLLFLLFWPFIYFKRNIFFLFVYSLYFVLIQYLFYIFDDLGLSFLQLYFTQSNLYLFYPLFSFGGWLVNFSMILLIFILYLTRKFVFISLLLGFLVINWVLRFYYFGVMDSNLLELDKKLRAEKVFLFVISTNTVAISPDYRVRNEDMVFNKLVVSLAFASRSNNFSYLFLLPEGSLSKNERYLFDISNPSRSPALYNLREGLVNLIDNNNISRIADNSYVLFNPTLVDYSEKKIYNSVILINLKDILELDVRNYQFYNKVFLVPFSEFTPSFFRIIANLLSNQIAIFRYMDYTSGQNKQSVFRFKNINIKPLICFESFKSLYLMDKTDFDFIIVSSNDSWFRGNPMYSLHRKSIKLLSIKERKPVIFLVNGAISEIFMIFKVKKSLEFVILF